MGGSKGPFISPGPSLGVQVSVQKEGSPATWANTELDVNAVLSVLCL